MGMKGIVGLARLRGRHRKDTDGFYAPVSSYTSNFESMRLFKIYASIPLRLPSKKIDCRIKFDSRSHFIPSNLHTEPILPSQSRYPDPVRSLLSIHGQVRVP